MATRLKKMLNPILKEECNKAFKRGFEEGKAAGWEKRLLAYENELECLKYLLKQTHVRRWIPLSERVPDTKGTYLICTDKFGVVLAHWYGDRFGCGRASNHVIYWMPLPEPPME